jgi:hypothetical protein
MTDVKNIGEFDDLWRKSRGLEIQGILPWFYMALLSLSTLNEGDNLKLREIQSYIAEIEGSWNAGNFTVILYGTFIVKHFTLRGQI